VLVENSAPGDPPPSLIDVETVRLLIVEDDEEDFLITRDMLADQDRMRVAIDWVSDYDQALVEIRAQSHDAYLVDYRLGERTGLDLIREAFASRPVAPVIMLTGQPTAAIDLEATALGASGFLAKQQLTPNELERTIRHAISHQKAERHALAARSSEEGIWDWDIAAERLYSSPRLNAILGMPDEAVEIAPEGWFHLVAPDDAGRLRGVIEAHLAGQTPSLECEFRLRHRDGSWRWVKAHGLLTRDVDGTPIRMAGSLSDTTDRHAVQQRLEHEALHDTLTGLPNRTLFIDRVTQTLQRASRDPGPGCALLFLDVDEFKQINDSLSHAVGDKLLVAFAERIAAALRPGDTVARLGGDEFTVLLEDVSQPAEATIIAERILSSMREPFRIGANDLQIGASIGVAMASGGLSPADLISAADLAMYDAKRRGRGRWAVFDETMHQRATARLARQSELRQVIDHSLLEVHFQPIIELHSRRIVGLEALARWPSDRASVDPAEFIAIAEETGMIISLGEHVMRVALRTLAGWRREGLAGPDLWLSVNLSSRQVSDAGLPDQLRAMIAESGVEASVLRLEVVESTLIALQRCQPLLAVLTADGIGLHIDDFGSGYSSLAALHRLPIRALKIDRDLVSRIDDDENRTIARSVIALAHSLDVTAIGAGVESELERQALTDLGCDAGQGMLMAPALASGAIAQLLARVPA
jgi:diguanylate cyclase (GGDEF)-like protein/PAS domain S-box-containing protein